MTIYKYKLNDTLQLSTVEAPIVSPLWVDYQNGEPYVWAIIDPNTPVRRIHILQIGTGQPFGDGVCIGNYLNTTVAQSEPFVWHWFWMDAEE